MTKAEVVDQIVKTTNLDKNDVVAAVNAFTQVVSESVAEGKIVTIRGFGSFQPQNWKARKGRNIAKGTLLDIPARTHPTFLPAAEFKTKVDEAHK